MDLKFIGKLKISLFILIPSFIFCSCKSDNNLTGNWISYDSDLYNNTTLQIFDNNQVLITNLPLKIKVYDSNDYLIDTELLFDSEKKEAILDIQNKQIQYQNFSQIERANIIFSTKNEIDILFPNGSLCVFIRQ